MSNINRMKQGALWFFKSNHRDGWTIEISEKTIFPVKGAGRGLTATGLHIRIEFLPWAVNCKVIGKDEELALPGKAFERGCDIVSNLLDEIRAKEKQITTDLERLNK